MNEKLLFFLVACLSGGVVCRAQDTGRNALAERASQEFRAKNFAAAERDFRELTKVDPANLYTQAYLGHALFRQEKFAEAIVSYEKALELERAGKKLAETEHRVLVDQLVMSYGVGGQLKKAHQLLDDEVQKDPDYPLNYYNLACAYSEEGDKSKMLAALRQSFERKQNVLAGEQMPDPRVDSSFQKYARDADFAKLMKDLGLK